MKTTVTAFAPATVANVAVGFDVLGFAVEAAGDLVTVSRTDRAGAVELAEVAGAPQSAGIPLDPAKNTATAGLLRLCRELKLPFGLRVSVNKGIPLGSGLGGSAASAVGAIVAANALLDRPLTREQLLDYALEGESVASGARHADNVAPCLLGGLTLVRSVDPTDVVSIPTPPDLAVALVHPDLRVETRHARAVLRSEVPLNSHVRQSANLAAFIAGCFQRDLALIGRSLTDELIEPQRSHLIPAFGEVKRAALAAGALGCSISGAGPAVFALAPGQTEAERIRGAMTGAFAAAGVAVTGSWASPVRHGGAALEGMGQPARRGRR